MAYNLASRFPQSPKYYTLLDPGAYQTERGRIKESQVPFSSITPRNTQFGAKIWTHSIYYGDYPPKIPNCTSLKSKRPRFPYESFSKEDLEHILCRCGFRNACECPSEEVQEEEEEINCQAHMRRRIFKGSAPRSILGEGLSVPSRRDNGFKILKDGSIKPMKEEVNVANPPFYDAQVNESTAFYQGCKWSQWTSQRSVKSLEARPGPADYTLHKTQITEDEICAEKFRSYRRQTSKQLRFIEMVQQRNVLEGRPGPATYSPTLPKVTNLQFYGPKASRFPVKGINVHPGPADHWLKRDFDPLEFPEYPCHAKLPKPSCFGVKAPRFKPRKEEGPSPATYSVNNKSFKFMNCSTIPFGTTAKRFKENHIVERNDEEIVTEVEPQRNEENHPTKELCQSPTWEFKSKTIRMKPLIKQLNEPSPADLPQSQIKIERLSQLQYTAPFYSSEGRSQPWNDWVPVYGKLQTPGPGYYNLERPKCYPAVHRGPLYRAERFPSTKFQTPAPNEFPVGGDIESILATHNQRLKDNIENQHTFNWKPPVIPRKLTFEEKESLLLHKSIALLDVPDIFEDKGSKSISTKSSAKVEKRKMHKLLRCFLYRKPITQSF